MPCDHTPSAHRIIDISGIGCNTHGCECRLNRAAAVNRCGPDMSLLGVDMTVDPNPTTPDRTQLRVMEKTEQTMRNRLRMLRRQVKDLELDIDELEVRIRRAVLDRTRFKEDRDL